MAIAGNAASPVNFDHALKEVILALSVEAKAFSTLQSDEESWHSAQPAERKHDDDYTARRIKKLLKVGSTSKIARALESKGIADLANPEIRLNLHEKFPKASPEMVLQVPRETAPDLIDIGPQNLSSNICGNYLSVQQGLLMEAQQIE